MAKTIERIERAIILATEAHSGQKDKSGQPYILHPLAVAEHVHTKYKNQHWPYTQFTLEDLIVAAVLHDVVEDTTVTLEQIEDEFGPIVREIVDGVTRRKRPPMAETYMDFIRRAKKHIGSRMVKLADLHHNMSRISNLPLKEQDILQRYLRAEKILNS